MQRPSNNGMAFLMLGVTLLLIFGFAVWRPAPPQSGDCSECERSLAAVQAQLDQERNEWDAADVTFLDRHTKFTVRPDQIVKMVQARYAVTDVKYGASLAGFKTALGASIEMAVSGQNAAETTIQFNDGHREHGLELVELISGMLVGAGRHAKDVVQFACADDSRYGNVVFHVHDRGAVSTVIRERVGYEDIYVHIIPTGNP